MTNSSNSSPLVWVLLSPHQGDNTQLRAIAQELGFACVEKHLEYRKHQTLARLTLGATLIGLEKPGLQAIIAPWPQLVLCSGRPTEAVALWLKNNHGARIVFVGTPWADLSNFDLVIATPQYRLPQRSNVVCIDLPVHRYAQAKAQPDWREKLSALPRPLTGVLVGGPSGPYGFDAASGTRLAHEANGMGGSLAITTSARTPPETARALEIAITPPHVFHAWQKDSTNNPFASILALADQFIVTADSISMLSEAVATGKPVFMFDTETGKQAMRDANSMIHWQGHTLSQTLFRLFVNHAPYRWSRDLRVVHNRLLRAGRVAWLGDPPPQNQTAEAPELTHVVTRILKLFQL